MKNIDPKDPEIIKIVINIQSPDSSSLTKQLLTKYNVKEVYEFWAFFDEIHKMWAEYRMLDGNEE